MDNEEKSVVLISEVTDNLKRVAENLGSVLNIIDKSIKHEIKTHENNDKLFVGIFEHIKNLYKITGFIFVLLFIILFGGEILSILLYLKEIIFGFWYSLSENWQTTLFNAVLGFFIFFLGRSSKDLKLIN